MRQTTTPAPAKGQESLSKFGGRNNTPNHSSFKPPMTDSERLLVLASLANRWASLGLYASPAVAMSVLLEGIT